MRQISLSTECVTSSIKNQLKALSNRRNLAIYKDIGVEESNADVMSILYVYTVTVSLCV